MGIQSLHAFQMKFFTFGATCAFHIFFHSIESGDEEEDALLVSFRISLHFRDYTLSSLSIDHFHYMAICGSWS